MQELVEKLTGLESSRLQELETVVRRNMRAFLEFGLALQEIKDRRLHRETHETFDEYVRATFDMQAGNAYRKIRAASLTKRIEAAGVENLPENEAQARELLGIKDKENQVQVWAEVCDDAADRDVGINAALVKAHVEQQTNDNDSGDKPPPPKPPAPKDANRDFDSLIAAYLKLDRVIVRLQGSDWLNVPATLVIEYLDRLRTRVGFPPTEATSSGVEIEPEDYPGGWTPGHHVDVEHTQFDAEVV